MGSFNRGYIDFLSGLDENNTKQWFKANKKWYELAVREPFKNFLEQLRPGILKLDESIKMPTKEALFRINNDLRFLKNQVPYKTHMAAGFSRNGRKSQFAGFYIQIGHKQIAIGGGLPYLESEVLRKIRIEIGYNTQKFNNVLESASFKRYFDSLLGEKDNDLPKSFEEIASNNPIIAKKQFYYCAFYETESLLFRDDLIEFILDHFRAGIEVNMFLINTITNFSKQVMSSTQKSVLQF